MFGTLGDALSFVAHVTKQDGRTLEQLLSPQHLGAESAPVGGAIVDATYVRVDPAILVRLADSRIPWAIDPNSVRFHSPRYLSIRALAGLPYAPSAPLGTSGFTDRHRAMVRDAIAFQASHEPSMYVVPSLPVPKPSAAALRAWQDLHTFAAGLNGIHVPYRPMLASVYPGFSVIRGRFSVFDRLADRAWAGVYVQPLHLNSKRDSVEKLVAYLRFLEEATEAKFHVIAGRPGAFGLVMSALGIEYFDAGLDGGDSFDLTRLDREPRVNVGDEKGGGGHKRSVYVRRLMSALPDSTVDELLSTSALRAQLACDIGACSIGGYRYAVEHPKEHFFHTRQEELSELRSAPQPLRLQLVNDWLEAAIAASRLTGRVREEQELPALDFSHLGRWRSVLARVAALVVMREA